MCFFGPACISTAAEKVFGCCLPTRIGACEAESDHFSQGKNASLHSLQKWTIIPSLREYRMDLTFSFQNESDYLGVELAGEWNLEGLKYFAQTLLSRAKDRGQKTILIDALKTNTAPTIGTSFFYGEYISTLFLGFKIALVIRREFITGLFENVAVNRGVLLSVFEDRQSALIWLLPPEK
jgi:hypothetical protein